MELAFDADLTDAHVGDLMTVPVPGMVDGGAMSCFTLDPAVWTR